MSMSELYSRPGYLFRRMQQIAVALFLDECSAFDLTPVQYAALVAIGEHPGIDVTRLSALIAFDRSTLASVIERLESKDLIVRRATPGDKRLKLLHLKPRARQILATIGTAVDRAQERMLAPLNRADRQKLLQMLSRLVESNNESSRVPLRVVAGR